MTAATKELTGRIELIPTYFGGDGANGDCPWRGAFAALRRLAKDDPLLELIADQLDDAKADCVESAVRYGRALGTDAESDVAMLSDEEYEDRMGKARKA